MGRHNAKLMLSTLWCRQLTRLSALGAAKSGLPHRPLDRKTCPSHFDALRTVYGTKRPTSAMQPFVRYAR
jgi:hypothetical protein